MIFRKVHPAKNLRHIIRYFWWIELNCTEDYSERILPDGSSEMVFHLGDRVSRTTPDTRTQSEPNCFLAGQNTTHYNITAQGFVRMIGVKLYAHTASFLLRENAMRFNDSAVDLAAIWGDSVNDIHGLVVDAVTLEDRISVLENFFAQRLPHKSSVQFEYLSWA